MSEDYNCDDFQQPKLMRVPIKRIIIPEIRVTSVIPEELEDLFKRSIKLLGIVNPIKLICSEGNLILVDGLHRLLEARDKGQEEIEAVIAKGTLRDVLIQNLATGKLQGRGKITDMIKVVKYLNEEEGMGIDEIAKSTGYTEEYVDNLLRIANANPEILDALDKELIPLGAAVEISRIPDEDAQVTVLYQAIAYRMRVKDVKDVVDRVIKLKQSPEQAAKQVAEKPAREEVLLKCHICGNEWKAKDMRSIIICPECFMAVMEVQRELREELMRVGKANASRKGEVEEEVEEEEGVEEEGSLGVYEI